MRDPTSENIRALFRYERGASGEIRFVEVRRLPPAEWQEVSSALATVRAVVRSFDRFLEVAWTDLERARDQLLDQATKSRHLMTDAFWLLEYRVLGFSTALWLYQEYVTAEANRTDDEAVRTAGSSKLTGQRWGGSWT
ncbi:MAG: hypothetical protein ACOH2F_15735 [Cellulomonas sp.]